MSCAVERKHLIGMLTHGQQLPEIKIATHRSAVSYDQEFRIMVCLGSRQHLLGRRNALGEAPLT
ncbi:MAG: hypothetical protein JOY71_02315 [Acetobacteraceae bacterium]|nr:hypothetical protein [Acetobacteraceae bacterium]